MDTAEKVRENLARRRAARQGLRLQKSPRRDPQAWDYGTWQLVNEDNVIVAQDHTLGRGYGLSLDAIEEFLDRGR